MVVPPLGHPHTVCLLDPGLSLSSCAGEDSRPPRGGAACTLVNSRSALRGDSHPALYHSSTNTFFPSGISPEGSLSATCPSTDAKYSPAASGVSCCPQGCPQDAECHGTEGPHTTVSSVYLSVHPPAGTCCLASESVGGGAAPSGSVL